MYRQQTFLQSLERKLAQLPRRGYHRYFAWMPVRVDGTWLWFEWYVEELVPVILPAINYETWPPFHIGWVRIERD